MKTKHLYIYIYRRIIDEFWRFSFLTWKCLPKYIEYTCHYKEKNKRKKQGLRFPSSFLGAIFDVHGFLCQVAVAPAKLLGRPSVRVSVRKAGTDRPGSVGFIGRNGQKRFKTGQLGKDWNRFKQRRKTSELNLHNAFLRGIEAKSLRSCIVKDQCGYHPAWSEQRRSAWLGIYRTSQIMTWASTALSWFPLTFPCWRF